VVVYEQPFHVYPRENTFIGDFALDVRQLDVQAMLIVATADNHRAAGQYLNGGEMSTDGTKKGKILKYLSDY